MPRGAAPFRNPWSDRDVEAHWDRVAPIYVAENEKVKTAHDQRFHEAMRHIALPAGATVLNVTSREGDADLHIRSAQPDARVVNAEISQGLIDVAARRHRGLDQVKLETYSRLPFDDDMFDRIVSLETLEHVADPVAFLTELHRVSRPDGRMVLSCPPATSEPAYRVYTALFGGHGEGPHRFPSSRTVKDWLARTGWSLLAHKGTVLVPVGPAWLQAFGEAIIGRFQNTFVSELGIRQFYVCCKS